MESAFCALGFDVTRHDDLKTFELSIALREGKWGLCCFDLKVNFGEIHHIGCNVQWFFLSDIEQTLLDLNAVNASNDFQDKNGDTSCELFANI